MDLIPQDDVLQIAITLWSFLGERIHHTSRRIKLFRIFNCMSLTFALFFILANLTKVEGVMYIKTIEGAITIIHTLIKYLLFSYNKQDICDIIKDRSKFWIPKDFGNKLKKDAHRVFYFTKAIQKMIIVTLIINIELKFLKPAYDNSNRFLYQSWTIYNNIILDTTILILQYYFLCIVAPIIAGYDAIYFSICSHILIQLRLLKYKVKHMKTNENISELYSCIRHHQLISSVTQLLPDEMLNKFVIFSKLFMGICLPVYHVLLYHLTYLIIALTFRIFGRMRRIYSWMLLFHYLVTLITACSQLYAIMLGELQTADAVSTVVYIIDVFAQFGYYTFPVEEVVFEFTDLANAVYMSEWFDRDESTKKSLLIVMTKAQNQRYFSGGGMIEINVNAFGSVVRKTFSFYAILKNVI